MGKTPVVGSMSEWSGVLKDFFRQVNDGSIDLVQVQAFLDHKNPFEIISLNFCDLIKDWQKFYREVFGIETDFSNLRIPEKKKGFDRLIIVAQRMSPQMLYDKCEELFPCWKWTNNNLDKIISSGSVLSSGVSFARWFRDRVEADEELKNLSANQLKEKNIQGITLEERLLYELKFFKETGKHLDIQNVTLCTGSRYDDGGVPFVYWLDSMLSVHWYRPGHANDNLRSRQAVS